MFFFYDLLYNTRDLHIILFELFCSFADIT